MTGTRSKRSSATFPRPWAHVVHFHGPEVIGSARVGMTTTAQTTTPKAKDFTADIANLLFNHPATYRSEPSTATGMDLSNSPPPAIDPVGHRSERPLPLNGADMAREKRGEFGVG